MPALRPPDATGNRHPTTRKAATAVDRADGRIVTNPASLCRFAQRLKRSETGAPDPTDPDQTRIAAVRTVEL
jgi:hypothetical protein